MVTECTTVIWTVLQMKRLQIYTCHKPSLIHFSKMFLFLKIMLENSLTKMLRKNFRLFSIAREVQPRTYFEYSDWLTGFKQRVECCFVSLWNLLYLLYNREFNSGRLCLLKVFSLFLNFILGCISMSNIIYVFHVLHLATFLASANT